MGVTAPERLERHNIAHELTFQVVLFLGPGLITGVWADYSPGPYRPRRQPCPPRGQKSLTVLLWAGAGKTNPASMIRKFQGDSQYP